MHIEVILYIGYLDIQGVEMLTLTGALFCVGFINPIDVIAGVPRQRLPPSIGPN
jgi:hypothetical protein